MNRPRHEPEVIRAQVSEVVGELRELLRAMGLGAHEVASMTRQAERDAATFVHLMAELREDEARRSRNR